MQSEFWHEKFLCLRKILRNSPKMFEPLFCGSEKNPAKLPPNYPPIFSRKGRCRNPRGFIRKKSRVNLAGDLLVDFFGPFSLEKKQEKNSTQKSTAKFKSEFGSFVAEIHTARIRPRECLFQTLKKNHRQASAGSTGKSPGSQPQQQGATGVPRNTGLAPARNSHGEKLQTKALSSGLSKRC